MRRTFVEWRQSAASVSYRGKRLQTTPSSHVLTGGKTLPTKGMARVLMYGECPEGAAPLLTLANALRRLDYEVTFPRRKEISNTIQQISYYRRADVVVATAYQINTLYLTRQLALAVAFGRPVIRRWVGTDVWHCLNHDVTRRASQRLDRLVSAHVTVAPHLCDELEQVGIASIAIPDERELPRTDGGDKRSLPRRILIYLPANRRAFYNGDLVERLIHARPDLPFIVVGDQEHRLARFANVTSLGWVDDMEIVWPQVGCLLRVTEHDGCPRMVLDALARQRYVIFSHAFPGCWLARSFDEVQDCVARFQTAVAPNVQGRAAAEAMLTPSPAKRFAEVLEAVVRPLPWRLRLRAWYDVVALTLEMKATARLARVNSEAYALESS